MPTPHWPNDHAYETVKTDLAAGEALTLAMLATVFGVETIHDLTRPDLTTTSVARFARELTIAAVGGLLANPALVAAETPKDLSGITVLGSPKRLVLLDPDVIATQAVAYASHTLRRFLSEEEF